MAYYEITLDHYLSSYCPADDRSYRKRSDAAKGEAYRMIYEMCESEGLLDRPVAHRLIAELDAADISPVKPGWTRKIEFRLREKEEFPRVAVRITAN